MMDKEKQNRIDKYLLDLADPDERTKIEQEMAEDPEFKAYVDRRRTEIMGSFEYFAEKKVEDILFKLGEEQQLDFTDDELEDYVRGDLPEGFRQALEMQMKKDEVLRKRVEAEKVLQENLGQYRDDMLKKQIKELNSQREIPHLEEGLEKNKPKPLRVLRSRGFWLAAASILLLVLAFAIMSRLEDYRTFDYEQEFARYDKDQISPLAQRTGFTGPPAGLDTLLAAIRYYVSEEPRQAEEIFDYFLAQQIDNELRPYALFYSAQLKMERFALPEAEDLLRDLEADYDDFPLYNQSMLYLAILYLENEERAKARTLLLELKEKDFNTQQIDDLLKYTKKPLF